MSKPTPMVAANWKCNGTVASAEALLKTFVEATIDHDVDCIVAAPALHLGIVKKALATTKQWEAAAENVVPKSGAFTGEHSVAMLKDFGINWTIIGHSERRQYWNETDAVVAEKVAAALAGGLKVIACIGEHLKEREEGRTADVVLTQLKAIANVVKPDQWKDVVIAYEPVWAIGTGKVATTEQAQEVHAIIRDWIVSNVSDEVAKGLRILYGGSVTPANSKSLYECKDINGFLVGGASLKPDFVQIVLASKL